MKDVHLIIFRYLNKADFFNIYKPSGTEAKGGGQAYIDFPVRAIPLSKWQIFFAGLPNLKIDRRTAGPSWTFHVHSIGVKRPTQKITLYQRRKQSVSISSQRITSPRQNRVHTWHPSMGFPEPSDPLKRDQLPNNLAIFILRTTDNEVWAGWFRNNLPCKDDLAKKLLAPMLNNPQGEGYAGFIQFNPGTLSFDENETRTPFLGKKFSQPTSYGATVGKRKIRTAIVKKSITRKEKGEQEILKSLFDEDENVKETLDAPIVQRVQRIRLRNARAIKDLKNLYNGRCQISGEKLTFKKKDGQYYCEAHHLVPLGEEGADSPYNIIIISPLIHRMLHYANIEEIDLSQIKDDHTLDIKINGKPFTIRWHPQHAALVKKYHPKRGVSES